MEMIRWIMKTLRSNNSRAFAEGFERGFNAPFYFLFGDKPKINKEKTVTIRAIIRTEKDDKEKSALKKHAKTA